MLVRTLAALAIVAAMQNGTLLAQQNDPSPTVGDLLFIRMTGDLAKQYVRCTGRQENEPPSGLTIETTATVAQNLDDGRIRIEHSSSIKRDANAARLVTLTATVDPTKITADVTPKGTPIYASPAAHKNGAKPTLTREDAKTLRLHLSDLKGIKLRTWSLAEEIGD